MYIPYKGGNSREEMEQGSSNAVGFMALFLPFLYLMIQHKALWGLTWPAGDLCC